MRPKEAFLYRQTMRESRNRYKQIGIPLVAFLVLFGMGRDFIVIPLMGKIWGLALSTTPEGFVSNANLVNSLVKSPWIIPIGAVLVIFYGVIALWQSIAIIMGITYLRNGQKLGLGQLIRLSFQKLKGGLKAENWMLMVYSLLILPLANVYQTNDLVGSFIIPEYIQDFINSKTLLFVIFLLLMAAVIYFALKWVFVLPAFILRNKSFRDAGKESGNISSGQWLKNGINIGLYSIIELVRLSIIPVLLIILPVSVCHWFTRDLNYAGRLFNIMGVSLGLETARSITASLVQISTLTFITELYFLKLRQRGEEQEIVLPEAECAERSALTINKIQTLFCGVFALIVAGGYLAAVSLAQTDSDFILSVVGKTEIIAHKGYSSKAPENTMPAFELADKCGQVTYIELDVWSSKDGVPVVLHNETIEDATGIDRPIYDCTYAELKEIPAPYGMKASDFPDARIPGLEEVIQKYAASTPLLIEIKGFRQDPELPAKIVSLMKKYSCEDRSMVQSGDPGALVAVKKADPSIKCGLIMAIVTGDYYDLPYVDFFSIEHTFVDEDTVAHIHRHGKGVFAWTVNYPESANALMFSGVDGLITDEPEEMNKYTEDINGLVEEATLNSLLRCVDARLAGYDIRDYSEGNY